MELALFVLITAYPAGIIWHTEGVNICTKQINEWSFIFQRLIFVLHLTPALHTRTTFHGSDFFRPPQRHVGPITGISDSVTIGIRLDLAHQGPGHYKHCQKTHHTVLIQLIYLLPFRLRAKLWSYKKGRKKDCHLWRVSYLLGTLLGVFHTFNSNEYLCIRNRQRDLYNLNYNGEFPRSSFEFVKHSVAPALLHYIICPSTDNVCENETDFQQCLSL